MFDKKQYNKIWYENNKEYFKRYYKRNRKSINEYQRLWCRNNPLSVSTRNKKSNKKYRDNWISWFHSIGKDYCIKCHYHKCFRALDFHHIKDKIFGISWYTFKHRCSERHTIELLLELNKCIVLCSNCHQELHDGLWNIADIDDKNKIT